MPSELRRSVLRGGTIVYDDLCRIWRCLNYVESRISNNEMCAYHGSLGDKSQMLFPVCLSNSLERSALFLPNFYHFRSFCSSTY